MWTLGISDKHLLGKVLRMLKAPIKLPNGQLVYPEKGMPQGGIISPLLANIVLKELNYCVQSNWEENPVVYKYSRKVNTNGTVTKRYRAVHNTNLKEICIVRCAGDLIF